MESHPFDFAQGSHFAKNAKDGALSVWQCQREGLFCLAKPGGVEDVGLYFSFVALGGDFFAV